MQKLNIVILIEEEFVIYQTKKFLHLIQPVTLMVSINKLIHLNTIIF
jgi:hypothetical protein